MRTRFVIVGSLMAILVACVASTALIPSYLAARAVIKNSVSSKALDINAADRLLIVDTQELSNLMRPLVIATTTPTETILTTLAAKPEGISIDHISYLAGVGGKGSRITLAGIAQSPDLIRSYREILAADKHFKNVSVPVDALVGTKDGRFTISIEGN